MSTKLKAAGLGAWWSFFAAVGAVLALGLGYDDGAEARLIGVAIAIPATPVSVYWLLQLLPGACRLTVADDGLRIRHSFVTHRRRWEDIDRFYTRTYWAYRFPDWTGVAFARRDGWKANAASLLEDTFRTRGVFDTDLLPDTYGLQAKKLCSFPS